MPRKPRIGDLVWFDHLQAAHKVKRRPGVIVHHESLVFSIVVGTANQPKHNDVVLVAYDERRAQVGLTESTYFNLRDVATVHENAPNLAVIAKLPMGYWREIQVGLASLGHSWMQVPAQSVATTPPAVVTIGASSTVMVAASLVDATALVEEPDES